MTTTTTTTTTPTTLTTLDGVAIHPFIDPAVGRHHEAMRCHPDRALPLGSGHHTTRPSWPEAALLYIRQEMSGLRNGLAPNPAI